MKFHSNRNDRSWHTAERRIAAALRDLYELTLALQAAGLPLPVASDVAYKAIRKAP